MWELSKRLRSTFVKQCGLAAQVRTLTYWLQL